MAKHTVEILPPMSYSPPSIEIMAGDTVEWISRDDNDVHTVTHDDDPPSFRSDALNGGGKFEHAFPIAGDFPYFCEVHGKAMSGVVKVKTA
jgi:plastocyanin